MSTNTVMVDRRNQLEHHEDPERLIAYTAHDLMTPLTGVQLSLSLLKDDRDVKEKLSTQQMELLATAANCSDLMIRICQTAIETLRQQHAAKRPNNGLHPRQRHCATATTTTATNSLLQHLQDCRNPLGRLVQESANDYGTHSQTSTPHYYTGPSRTRYRRER